MPAARAWPGLLPGALALVACTNVGRDPARSEDSTGVATGGPPGVEVTSGGIDPSGSTGPMGEGTRGVASSSGTTGAGSTSTGSTDTGSSTDSGSSDETTGSGAEPPCASGCAVEVACTERWPSERACVSACEANLLKAAEFERACAAAWADLHECLGTLRCEELAEWMEPMTFPYPCLSEDEVLTFECAGQ